MCSSTIHQENQYKHLKWTEGHFCLHINIFLSSVGLIQYEENAHHFPVATPRQDYSVFMWSESTTDLFELHTQKNPCAQLIAPFSLPIFYL